jgi:hypothetical protein
LRQHVNKSELLLLLLLVVVVVVVVVVGREYAVGIATLYGLDGPEIESRWGEIFLTRPDRPWAHPSSYAMGTGFFLEVKRPGRGVDHPPLSSAEVRERVELYLYSTSGSS